MKRQYIKGNPRHGDINEILQSIEKWKLNKINLSLLIQRFNKLFNIKA